MKTLCEEAFFLSRSELWEEEKVEEEKRKQCFDEELKLEEARMETGERI